jgi:hypothetical protein
MSLEHQGMVRLEDWPLASLQISGLNPAEYLLMVNPDPQVFTKVHQIFLGHSLVTDKLVLLQVPIEGPEAFDWMIAYQSTVSSMP